MNEGRITLTGVRVEGPAVASALIDFAPGLSLIVGASDTGKTYIFHTIDFLLGATAPPPDNPASSGYTRAYLGITVEGKGYTLERNLSENFVNVYEVPFREIPSGTAVRRLSATHRLGSEDTISHFLLSKIGLAEKSLRKNQYLEKASLTIRHVSHLTAIGEERIITKLSPALSGDSVQKPFEQAVFSYFLTGLDDADLTPVEKPSDKKARLDTEEAILQPMLEKKELHLHSLTGGDNDPVGRLAKIDAAIAEATELSAFTRGEINIIERERESDWAALQKRRSRRLFVGEQLKRLRLLQEFYINDRKRLETVMEAGRAFEALPGGNCAICGSTPDPVHNSAKVTEFQRACETELNKITQLSTELEKAVADMVEEDGQLRSDIERLDSALSVSEQKLQSVLRPQSGRADQGLSGLIRLKGDMSKAIDVLAEVTELKNRIESIIAARKTKAPKSSVPTMGTAKAAKFCAVVQATLEAWKCPIDGNVAFDPDSKRFDIVLGSQNRGSMGKGYRAITHAAFIIGLMRYCRQEKIPHPGFVVLDTPLNPFKGPDEGPEGKVNDQIKHAFFEDLANDTSGDQFIVLENTEPPPSILSKIKHHRFTKNPLAGRYGFFPFIPPSTSEGTPTASIDDNRE